MTIFEYGFINFILGTLSLLLFAMFMLYAFRLGVQSKESKEVKV